MTIKRIKRKSIFSLGAVYVLLLMAFLLSASCVYADKYDFSYESVHYWNRYSKNGRSIEVILGQSLMSIAIYNNNNVVFKEYFIGGTVLTNGKKVYLARKDTPHIRANIMCYDFEKGQYYTVAELPVEKPRSVQWEVSVLL